MTGDASHAATDLAAATAWRRAASTATPAG